MNNPRLTPVRLLAALSIAAWAIALLWPHGLGLIGISNYGTTFLDSYAILAALDAARAGLDPHAANTFDPLLRYHVYSEWWLALKWLGLGRAHNLPVALAWIAAFGVTAWTTARPAGWREALWLAVVLVSPPVLLAVDRANNDLVIFVLLAACGVAAAAGGGRRSLLAIAGIGLATGLKYYPVVAVLIFLWIRPVRKIPAVMSAAVAVAALALACVLADVARAPAGMTGGLYTMGAAIWWRDLGWSDAQARIPGLLLLGGAGVILAATGVTAGLAVRGGLRERLLAALSAGILLACFVSTVNFAYRWIFVVWIALWLWRRAAENLAPRQRFAAGLGCALVFLCLWLDGLLCLVVNQLPPKTQAWIEHLLLVYRWWTQPLHWLLMAMFAGWLLEAVLATAREWRAERAMA